MSKLNNNDNKQPVLKQQKQTNPRHFYNSRTTKARNKQKTQCLHKNRAAKRDFLEQ